MNRRMKNRRKRGRRSGSPSENGGAEEEEEEEHAETEEVEREDTGGYLDLTSGVIHFYPAHAVQHLKPTCGCVDPRLTPLGSNNDRV